MKPFTVLGHSALFPQSDPVWNIEIPPHLKRRDPRIWQMAYVAVARLLKNAAAKPKSILVGTALGALDETKGFLDGIFSDGFGSPKNFIASVHNSMAGKLALEFGISGPNLTFCDGQNSFASAIANCELLDSDDFPALVVAVDENIPLLDTILPVMPAQCRAYLSEHTKEGAIALLLANSQTLPAIRSIGPRFAGSNKDKACTRETVTALLKTQKSPDRFFDLSYCKSFLSGAAVCAAELQKNSPGSSIVTSYSPPSNAFSAIELLL